MSTPAATSAVDESIAEVIALQGQIDEEDRRHAETIKRLHGRRNALIVGLRAAGYKPTPIAQATGLGVDRVKQILYQHRYPRG